MSLEIAAKPKRVTALIQVRLSEKLKVCCLRWLNESFGPPKENCDI